MLSVYTSLRNLRSRKIRPAWLVISYAFCLSILSLILRDMRHDCGNALFEKPYRILPAISGDMEECVWLSDNDVAVLTNNRLNSVPFRRYKISKPPVSSQPIRTSDKDFTN